MPTDIASFPPAVQVMLTGLGFLVAVAVWGYGLLKKPNVAVTKDVIMPNVNVMDGQTIRDAANMLRETQRTQEARDHMLRDFQREMRRQSELLDSIDGRLRILESIDQRMADEYFAQRRARAEAEAGRK